MMMKFVQPVLIGLALILSTSTILLAKSETADKGGYTEKDKEYDLTDDQVAFIRPGLDVEVIRQKFIAELVDVNRFKVISRERLSELLEEHSLSLSGALNENSAVEIGNLIGVEGFIDGYASIENGRLRLSFTLVETKSGIIIWAKYF